MIKNKTINIIESNYKTQEIQGPPLDFSFKNLRNVTQILSLNKNNNNNPKVAGNEQVQKNTKNIEHSSEKQIQQNVTQAKLKLNIVRTIDIEQVKGDFIKELANHKTQKIPSKNTKKVEKKTTSLFLRYNKIVNLQAFSEVIQQILPQKKWQQLIWIDLSHNRLVSIHKDIQTLPQLKNLYLHVNFISNFKQFDNLKDAKLLRTFTIHGNPIENYPQFRCLLVGILPQLQKIDSALLTKRQKERGEILKKSNAKYPVIMNPQKPPLQSQQQEQN